MLHADTRSKISPSRAHPCLHLFMAHNEDSSRRLLGRSSVRDNSLLNFLLQLLPVETQATLTSQPVSSELPHKGAVAKFYALTRRSFRKCMGSNSLGDQTKGTILGGRACMASFEEIVSAQAESLAQLSTDLLVI